MKKKALTTKNYIIILIVAAAIWGWFWYSNNKDEIKEKTVETVIEKVVDTSINKAADAVKEKAVEKEWKQYPSKLSLRWNTPVLPIFFEGQNSNVFHLANKIGQTFKYSVLMYELRKKMGTEINVHIGKLINFEKISSIGDLKKITQFLHKETYKLDPDTEKYLS